MGPEAAKEMRVFGLAGWFTEEFIDATREHARPGGRPPPAASPGAVPRLHGDRAGDRRGGAGVDRPVRVGRRDHADRARAGHPVGRRRDRARRVLPRVGRADAVRDAGRRGAGRVRGADGGGRGEAAAARSRTTRAGGGAVGRAPGSRTCASPTRARRPVLDGLDLELPAGRRWRSSASTAPARPRWSSCSPACTSPTAGRITVDGIDLADLDAPAWQPPGRRDLPGLRPLRAVGRDNVAVRRACTLPRDRTRCDGRSERAGVRRRRSTTLPARLETTAVPRSTRAAPTCPAGSGSGSPWPARCSRSRPARGSWCSTSRPPPGRAGRGRRSSTGSSS